MSELFGSMKWAAVSSQKSATLASLFCLLTTSYFLLLPAPAQEDAELPPPPKRPGVQITFIPPPLTGTLSLGIYNKAGKLVRTLHREAKTKEFVVGLNGLITWWDGKDDAGAVAPKGNYSVRGYAVGAVEFQGEAFHFNDWIVDEKSPRIRRIESITRLDGEVSSFVIGTALADGRKGAIQLSRDGKKFASYSGAPEAALITGQTGTTEEGEVRNIVKVGEESFGLRAGQIVKKGAENWDKVELSPVENALYFRPAWEREGVGWWLIDKTTAGAEIKRFAPDGAFVRNLVIPADQPQPFGLCFDDDDSLLILLEEAPGLQRVRTLERRQTDETEAADPNAPKTSDWAVCFSKIIRASDTLADVQANLKTEGGEVFAGVERISVRLLPNQLVQNKITSVDVGVAVDAKGSFLRTADGLPLKRITETPGLKWVAMMREPDGGKAVTIFQSDGAVVEEFKAKKLASMMAFDAGDYEWAGK